MTDTVIRDKVLGDEARAAELRRVAAALRARLLFHAQCGIAQYPIEAAYRPVARPARPAQAMRPAQNPVPQPGRNMPPHNQVAPPHFAPVPPPVPAVPAQKAAASPNIAPDPEALRNFRAGLLSCTRCGRNAPTRVASVGQAGARLMFIGDFCTNPDPDVPLQLKEGETLPPRCFGPEEDLMLWRMVHLVLKVSAETVYVANLCKCVGEKDRPEDAVRHCLPLLLEEIAMVRPQMLCVMGDLAARTLLATREPVLRLRGLLRALPENVGGANLAGLPLWVTYHPRFLLRARDMKRAANADLEDIRAWLRQHAPA